MWSVTCRWGFCATHAKFASKALCVKRNLFLLIIGNQACFNTLKMSANHNILTSNVLQILVCLLLFCKTFLICEWFLRYGDKVLFRNGLRGRCDIWWFKPGVPNSSCSVGQMRTCKVTRGPHYDADETIAVPELIKNSFYILFPAKGIMSYRLVISSRLYVGINQF